MRDFVPRVRIATVHASDATMTVSLPATTNAFEAANIYARASGYVDRRYVETAVIVGLHRGQLHHAAHPVQRRLRGRVWSADLVALTDRHDAEQPHRGVGDAQQMVHEGAVAVLEDVQRHADTREHHGVQREERQLLGHALNIGRGSPPAPPGPEERTTRPGGLRL